MKLTQIGVAAIALGAMTGAASATTYTGTAADCSGCEITVITSGSTYTPPPLPFTALDLGTGTGGFQSSATLDNPGGEISSISFADGQSPGSGVYSGNTPNVALSPFGGDSATTNDTPDNNYLVAQGGGGAVTINYFSAQTSLDLLWGTVDSSPADYNDLSFSIGTQMVTGADIAAIVNDGSFSSGDLDVAVEITGLTSFTTVTATDNASPAFEFDVAAPAPAIGHGLPVALAVSGLLVGAGFWQRRKNHQISTAAAPEAA